METLEAAAPTAAPAPAKAPALPNAPKVELKVSQIAPPAEAPAAPKKGSAREQMFKELEKRAGQEPGTERTPPPENLKEKTPEPEVKPADGKEKEALAEAPKEGEVKPGEAEKKSKVSPWKIVDEYKQKLAKAESDKLEVEKRAIPEAKWKEKEAELESKSKRLNELEEEIRFVNYSKSEEFKTKYQEPYDKAWHRAMSELGELQVEEGETLRAMQPNDLLELVNLPLGRAHELAVEKFGDLAPEAMAHRKEIRNLFDQQTTALEEARKSGAEREKSRAEQFQKQHGEVSTSIRETWSRSNEEITADPKYGKFFTPVEGDEQVNQRLAKGFELADRAFSENPMAPGLTAEQRQSIVKRHAAVRNRAAAFGRLVYQNTTLETKIADLQKIVDEYKGGEPERTGSRPAPAPAGQAKGIDGVFAELRKRAK